MDNIDPILNPTLFLGNFEWREPVTTLTDFLTAIVCFFIYLQFKRYKGAKTESFIHYQYYFLAFAIGMTSAAWFGHGLQAYVGFDWKKIGWVMSAIGFLNIELASIKDNKNILSQRVIKGLTYFVYLQFIVLVSLMVYYQNFKIPQINSTITFVLIALPLQLNAYFKTQKKGHLFFVFTIIYALLPGLIYNNKISINHWFNYHDISHVLMATFMLLLFYSVRKISFSEQ